MIKYPADNNRIVRGIIMSQPIARAIAAPRHLRACQQAVKKTNVQVLKDAVQVIGVALRRNDALSPSHLPHQVRLARHVLR